MKTIELKVYSLSELSDKAKEKALNEWLEGRDIPWSDENRATLEKFAVSFNISVRHWEYDYCGGYVRFETNWPEEVENLTGVRLAAFIWNNFKTTLFSGKYHSIKSDKKIIHKRVISVESKRSPGKYFNSYRSAIFMENSCELTGYCMDEEILGPIYDFLKKPKDINLVELFEECFDSWATACANDYAYSTSMEFFEEECESNDWSFEEDGTIRY